MNIELLKKLAPRFLDDVATEYNLPEFLGMEMKEPEPNSSLFKTYKQSENDNVLVVSSKIRPTGQLAAIVKELTVDVILFTGTKVVYGDLKYSYVHHSGGSNGKTVSLVVGFREWFGGAEPRYIGFVTEDVFRSIQERLV